MPTFLPDFIPLYDAGIHETGPAEAATESENDEQETESTSDQREKQTAAECGSDDNQSIRKQEWHDELGLLHTGDDDENNRNHCFKVRDADHCGPATPSSGDEVHPNVLFGRMEARRAAAFEARKEFWARREEPGQLFVRGDTTRETQMVTFHDGFCEIYWAGNQRHWRKRKRSTIEGANTVPTGTSVTSGNDLSDDHGLHRRDRSRSPLSRTVLEQDTERYFGGPIDEGTKLLASARKRPAWSDRKSQRTPHKKRRTGTSTSRSPAARFIFPNMPSTPIQRKKRTATEEITNTQEYQDWLRKWEEEDQLALKAIYDAASVSPIEVQQSITEDIDDEVFSLERFTISRFKPFF